MQPSISRISVSLWRVRLILALGRDDRVQVGRREERQDDEAGDMRTQTYVVQYRIDAPAGIYSTITIDEVMPTIQDTSMQLISVDPAFTGEQLDHKLVSDPVWHLTADVTMPPALATLTWQLRYPANVLPRFNYPAQEKKLPNGFLDFGSTRSDLSTSETSSGGKP